MNEWLTYVYNLVESCDYGDSSERIIRDVLIIGCNSDKAKDKIVRQGEKIKLQDVIEILQLEDSEGLFSTDEGIFCGCVC